MTDTPATPAAPATPAPVNTVLAASAKTAAQAAETAADAVAVKEEGKAESWLHKEWDAFEADLHAGVAAFVAKIKAKL